MNRPSRFQILLSSLLLGACGGDVHAASFDGLPSVDGGLSQSEGNGSTSVLPSSPSGGSSVPEWSADGGLAVDADVGPNATACAEQSAADCALRDRCTDGFENLLTYGSVTTCVNQLTAECLANLQSPDTANSLQHRVHIPDGHDYAASFTALA